MNPIQGIGLPASIGKVSPVGDNLAANPQEGTQSFKEFMLDSIWQVNQLQADAQKATETLITGGEINMAEVFTSVQKADLAFRMMQQIRNKLVQAYQEIKEIRI
ncbi:MAG: flagellar hook-basal body complex protein FliE [Pirellulaceae bacterium]|nr:flagellar hook-basal body complex protein FliE [Pirellulaceae bacterium]